MSAALGSVADDVRRLREDIAPFLNAREQAVVLRSADRLMQAQRAFLALSDLETS